MQGFASEVIKGLLRSPKYLPSKYFYNRHGDQIFRAIMRMEEYYLTRSEFEILLMNKAKLLSIFNNNTDKFHLIELGAGDGFKTKILLKHFLNHEADFSYRPVDISQDILATLVKNIRELFPDLLVQEIRDDYFNALRDLNIKDTTRKIVLFLGANIGNFTFGEALEFLRQLASNLSSNDLLMIGFDLKKNPGRILKAYNDNAGITSAFNFNLLKRINDELGGDFDISRFSHYPIYDPESGEAKSYLVSKEQQIVNIEEVNISINFEAGELIHMEISKKYNLNEITQLAEEAGFKVKQNFFDCKHYYTDSIWELK